MIENTRYSTAENAHNFIKFEVGFKKEGPKSVTVIKSENTASGR